MQISESMQKLGFSTLERDTGVDASLALASVIAKRYKKTEFLVMAISGSGGCGLEEILFDQRTGLVTALEPHLDEQFA
jgi:hypothetical protein